MKKYIKYLYIILIVVLFVFFTFTFNRIFHRDSEDNSSYIKEKKVDTFIETFNSIIVTDDGYAAVGSNNRNDNAYEKASISFFDSSRNKTMEKIYNKGYNSTFYDIVYDGDGYVTVGSFESSKKELEKSSRTALFVKYDKDGNIVFENDFQLIGDSYYSSVGVSDGNYYVCGSSYNVDKSSFEAIIVKYDKDGQEVWRKYFDASDSRYVDLEYYNGAIYLVGNAGSTGILSKYDLDGNNVFTTYSEKSKFNSLNIVNDSLYIVGQKSLDAIDVAFIGMYDFNLQLVFETDNDTYAHSEYKKALADDNGDLIVIGNSSANSSDKFGIIGKYSNTLKEMVVVKNTADRNNFFNDLCFFGDKYVVVGNYLISDYNREVKFFIFSKSLKKIGV